MKSTWEHRLPEEGLSETFIELSTTIALAYPGDSVRYYILKIYRYMGSSEELVNEELKKLSELIKSRVERNRGVKVIAVSVAERNRAEGMLLVGVKDIEDEKEVQFIRDYIASNFRHIAVGEARRLGETGSHNILELITNF
jgi:hypothetical protein